MPTDMEDRILSLKHVYRVTYEWVENPGTVFSENKDRTRDIIANNMEECLKYIESIAEEECIVSLDKIEKISLAIELG